MQYFWKSEAPSHIRWNNHWKDIENPNAIEAYQHFDNWNYSFHKHEKFILIELIEQYKKYIDRGSKSKYWKIERTIG